MGTPRARDAIARSRAWRVGQRDGACAAVVSDVFRQRFNQAVLAACLNGLRELHEALDSGAGRLRPAQRTLVRDGGFWSPQLELELDTAGYYSLISLPLGHKAAEEALQMAAGRGAMKPLSGKLSQVRAARMRTAVGSWTARWSWWKAKSYWQGKNAASRSPCAKRRWNCTSSSG